MVRGGGGKQFTNMGKLPNHWTDRDQMWHTYADSSRKVHRIKQINPSSPKGILERVMGSQIQKCGKDAKQLDRSGTNLANVCRSSAWEWAQLAKQINPSRHRGALWGGLGVTN